MTVRAAGRPRSSRHRPRGRHHRCGTRHPRHHFPPAVGQPAGRAGATAGVGARPGDHHARRRSDPLLTTAGNPILSVPDPVALEAALQELDLHVSLDLYVNETKLVGRLRAPRHDLPRAQRRPRHGLRVRRPVHRGDGRRRRLSLDGREEWEIMRDIALAMGRPEAALPGEPRALVDRMLEPAGLSWSMLETEHPHRHSRSRIDSRPGCAIRSTTSTAASPCTRKSRPRLPSSPRRWTPSSRSGSSGCAKRGPTTRGCTMPRCSPRGVAVRPRPQRIHPQRRHRPPFPRCISVTQYGAVRDHRRGRGGGG